MLKFSRAHSDLPVFHASRGMDNWFYTPGKMMYVRGTQDSVPTAVDENARNALDSWQSKHSFPFAPTCLTLYLSNRCNISCTYCYSSFDKQARVPSGSNIAGRADSLPTIAMDAVAAASRMVAENCSSRGLPFSFVVHGGGEPTATFESLQSAVEIAREAAASHGIDWTAYVSTNGVMSSANAAWIGQTFDEVGLSSDGPPGTHDIHRRTQNGRATSEYIERSAAILVENGTRLQVRATIMPETMDQQSDIVAYAAANLRATSVHIEPAYAVNGAWQPEDAEKFVDEFIAAEEVGRAAGVPVTMSGVRLDELHGPHCSISKDVLSITPDGSVTACFLTTDGRLDEFSQYVVGKYDETSGDYALDETHIEQMLVRAGTVPDECSDCVNIMHCARDCPDRCSLKSDDITGGFRCEVQRKISRHWLDRLATDLARAQ